jgi:hypothetical protein
MLLLSARQVRYCQVARQGQTGKVEVIPGIAYQGKIFIRGEIFPIREKERAIAYSRQQFSYYQEQVYILLVEDNDRLTLWYENSEVTPLPANEHQSFSDFISTIDLKQLVFQMRGEQGITMKTRRRGLRTFRQCFSAREAVHWLQKHLQISHQDAIRLGQRLLKENWIYPLTSNTNTFQNGDVLYRFRFD